LDMEGMMKDIFATDLVKMKIFATSSNKASQRDAFCAPAGRR